MLQTIFLLPFHPIMDPFLARIQPHLLGIEGEKKENLDILRYHNGLQPGSLLPLVKKSILKTSYGNITFTAEHCTYHMYNSLNVHKHT